MCFFLLLFTLVLLLLVCCKTAVKFTLLICHASSDKIFLLSLTLFHYIKFRLSGLTVAANHLIVSLVKHKISFSFQANLGTFWQLIQAVCKSVVGLIAQRQYWMKLSCKNIQNCLILVSGYLRLGEKGKIRQNITHMSGRRKRKWIWIT